MGFRPALWMTVCSVIALALLIALGSWQLYRMQWKAGLIAEFEARAHATPIDVTEIDVDDPIRYQRVKVEGTWLHQHEVQLIGRTFEGTAGYHVITPMILKDGRMILINRGWVSQSYRLPESRPFTLASDQVAFEGIIRLPAQKGYFVPENNLEQNDWFTLSISDIARYRSLENTLISSFTVDALRNVDTQEIPIGAAVDIELPNNHLQYAITWYGLALGLIGVYIAWHRSAGRIGRVKT